MRLKASILILAAAFATATAAHADFVYSGTTVGGDTFSLDLSVVAAGPGKYDVTSASGTVDGVTVGLLSDTAGLGNSFYSPSGYFIADNTLYTSGYPVDNPGILVTDGTNEINIFDNPPGVLYFNNGYNSAIDSYSLTATPEPSSLVLLGTGILGAAGAMRRRIRRS